MSGGKSKYEEQYTYYYDNKEAKNVDAQVQSFRTSRVEMSGEAGQTWLQPYPQRHVCCLTLSVFYMLELFPKVCLFVIMGLNTGGTSPALALAYQFANYTVQGQRSTDYVYRHPQ